MAFSTVPAGRYYGWTKAEVLARLATIKTALINRVPGQSAIVSVGGNGMSASYDPRAPGSVTMEEEVFDLQTALALVDDDEPEVVSEQTFSA